MPQPFEIVMQSGQAGSSDGFPQLNNQNVRYYSVHNPVIQKIQRRDKDIIGTADNGSGFVRLQLGEAWSTNSYIVLVGGLVYVKTASIDGIYTVTAIPDTTHIDIDAVFTAPEASGFVNFNSDTKNYNFQVRVTPGGYVGRFFPDSTGLCKANISYLMRKGLLTAPNFAFDEASPFSVVTGLKDPFLSANCFTDIKVNFDGAISTFFTPVGIQLYGINAGMQRDSFYFNSPVPFVTEIAGGGTFPAKWLTKFEDNVATSALANSPPVNVLWLDLPYDLQFIWSDLVETPDATTKMRKTQVFYIDNNIVAVGIDEISLTGATFINRVKITRDCASNGRFNADLSGWTQSNFTWSAGRATTTNALATLEQNYGIFPHELVTEVKVKFQQLTGFTAKLDIKDQSGTVIATNLVSPSIVGPLATVSGTGSTFKLSLSGGPGTCSVDWVEFNISGYQKVRVYMEAFYEGPPPVAVELTEHKWIEVREMPCNPVLVRWLGPNGSWEHWCFGTNQQEGLDVKEGELFMRFRDQYESPIQDLSPLSMQSTPTLECKEDQISYARLRGLLSMLGSPIIVILLNPDTWMTEGPKWMQVRIAPGSFKTAETRKTFHNFEAKFLKVRLITQSI